MSALIWHQLVRSRLQPAHLALKSMIKPRRPWAQDSLSRTLCAPFLCMARTGFSHIRLHGRSKGRPDSLVNPILLRQSWSAWCVGETQCQRRSHPFHHLSCSGCLGCLQHPTCRQISLPDLPENGRKISRLPGADTSERQVCESCDLLFPIHTGTRTLRYSILSLPQ